MKKGIAFVLAGTFICVMVFLLMAYISLTSNALYNIGDVESEQVGTKVVLKWADCEAPSYEIYRFKGLSVPSVYNSKKNNVSIETEVLGEEYRYIVFAKGEKGGLSAAATSKIQTKKLSQEIIFPQSVYTGIKGNKGKLEVKAYGYKRYSSSDASICVIDKEGVASFKKEGRGVITVAVSEGPQYLAAKGSVPVIVYPDTLRKPLAKVTASDNKNLAVVSWGSVPYASQYELQRYDPVKETFEKVGDFSGAESSAVVARKQSRYKVIAKATVGKESLRSVPSDDVVVKSVAEHAKTYNSSHDIKTLDYSNLSLITKVSGLEKAKTPQSMSIVKDNYVVAFNGNKDKAGALVMYDKAGNILNEKDASGMGHANGCTYNPYTDTIYTVRTHGWTAKTWSPKCTTFKGNLDWAEPFNLPKNTSGIAYDETINKYYLSKGNELYVADKEFNVEQFHWKKIRYIHAQDIAAYDGIIFVCTWVSGHKSYIDLYRAEDGEYLGSYYMPIGEIESCVIDVDKDTQEKHLVLLINDSTKTGDCIMRMDEPFDI